MYRRLGWSCPKTEITKEYFNFIGPELFAKVVAFVDNISKISEQIQKIDDGVEAGVPALRVIRAGARLTVHRALPFGVSSEKRCPPKIRDSLLFRPMVLRNMCGFSFRID